MVEGNALWHGAYQGRNGAHFRTQRGRLSHFGVPFWTGVIKGVVYYKSGLVQGYKDKDEEPDIACDLASVAMGTCSP